MKLLINGIEVEVSKDELTQGIEKGQFEIKSDLKVFKNEDFESFQKNLADNEYKKGKVAGEEILIKTGREKFGLEFEGKTLDNFAEAFKTKVLKEASIEPDKKVKELTNDNDQLRANLTAFEAKYQQLNQTIELEKKNMRIENILRSKLPKDKLSIPEDDVLFILKNKNQFDIDDKGSILIKNGEEIVKNINTLNPVTLDEFLPNIIKPYLKEVSGGAGGGDSSQNKNGTMQAFIKEMEDKGVKTSSLEFQKEMQKRISDKTLIP